MRAFLIGLLIFISAQSMAQTDTLAKPSILDMKVYKMTIPTGWKIKEGCVANQCTLLSPADTLSFFDKYTESINLTFNKLPSSKYTVDQYATFSINYLPKAVNNFKVIEKKKIKPNLIRLTYAGEKNGIEQTWRQYYHVKYGNVYIVTFSAETTKYAYHQPIVEPFLDSFMVK